MKTLHFGAVLAVVALTAFACNDDEDRFGLGNTAGKTTSEAGVPNDAGSAGQDSGDGGTNSEAGAAGSSMGGGGEAGAPDDAQAGAGGASGGSDGGGGGEAGGGGAPSEPLELIGEYDTNFGSTTVITADAWDSSAIAAYDNAQNVVYTQFPADDPYSPNKFAKTVYTEPANDSFYFCMVVYSADTLADAQASDATADDSDPESGGCGGQFPWTKATKQ